jgi:hypothetical protein
MLCRSLVAADRLEPTMVVATAMAALTAAIAAKIVTVSIYGSFWRARGRTLRLNLSCPSCE